MWSRVTDPVGCQPIRVRYIKAAMQLEFLMDMDDDDLIIPWPDPPRSHGGHVDTTIAHMAHRNSPIGGVICRDSPIGGALQRDCPAGGVLLRDDPIGGALVRTEPVGCACIAEPYLEEYMMGDSQDMEDALVHDDAIGGALTRHGPIGGVSYPTPLPTILESPPTTPPPDEDWRHVLEDIQVCWLYLVIIM
jgi:hypothetical protein